MSATIRNATLEDLRAIVAIYNTAIPGRMATADLEPVSVDSRRTWFNEHSSNARPLWVLEEGDEIKGWLSFQSFYGRPAYRATAELSVYIATDAQRRGYARKLVAEAIRRAPEFGLKTMLGFIFGHNQPKSCGWYMKAEKNGFVATTQAPVCSGYIPNSGTKVTS